MQGRRGREERRQGNTTALELRAIGVKSTPPMRHLFCFFFISEPLFKLMLISDRFFLYTTKLSALIINRLNPEGPPTHVRGQETHLAARLPVLITNMSHNGSGSSSMEQIFEVDLPARMHCL